MPTPDEFESAKKHAKPTTTPTGTPVPASVSAATLTHVGFTIAQAKRCSAASWHSRMTWARVASGFSSVWSRTAASVAAEESAWEAKAFASNGAGSAMERVGVMFIFVVMLLPGRGAARYFLS